MDRGGSRTSPRFNEAPDLFEGTVGVRHIFPYLILAPTVCAYQLRVNAESRLD